MKKKLVLMMLIILCTLTACGKKDEEDADGDNTTAEDATVISADVGATNDDIFGDDGVIDFDVDMGSTDVSQSNTTPSSPNMLPQSSTASKFTGETQSSGLQHTDVSQDNFHHIGKPVVKTASAPKEDVDVEEPLEPDVEEQKEEKKEDAGRAKFETLYDGIYIADDFDDDQVYILISMGDEWEYSYTYENGDKYSNTSEEDNRAVVYFNTTGLETLNITGCAMLHISDEDVEPVTGDSFSNGVFRCGIDFEPGEYNFLENGNDYYIAIYRSVDGSMSSMKNKPLAGVTYNTELKEGDYVYVASGVKMVKKEEAEDE